MVKKILFFLFAFSFAHCDLWYSNLEDALSDAKKNDKIVGLYFSESDYCPWCQKFEKEILSDEKFIRSVSPYLILVLIDFPNHKKMDEEQLKKNEKLKNKYAIEGFPTLVLLDSNQDEITEIGYLPITPEKYAENIIKIIKEYQELIHTNFEKLSSGQLKNIYEKAKTLGYGRFQRKCLDRGLKSSDNYFFCLEKYASLLKQNQLDQAVKLKKRMQYLDPNNIKKIHLKIALVDFENLVEKKDLNPEKVIEPLVEYIQKFGKKDKDHWRLEMMISQYLSSKGKLKLALAHARESYKSAPSIIKKDLAKTILYLKQKMRETDHLTNNKS